MALGLLSNTGNETAASLNDLLDKSGLSALVDVSLCLFSSVEGLDKTQPAFFVRLGGLRVAIAFGGMTRWVHNDSVSNSAFGRNAMCSAMQ